MPLSKARDRERKRLAKQVRLENVVVQPSVIWYAGASNHFGQVRNKGCAKQFFDELFRDRI